MCKQKEEIAMLLHKRHERIITQMKRELKKEGQGGVKKVQVICSRLNKFK